MPAAAPSRSRPAVELREIELHGHRVGFRIAGEGPLIVLIHGITASSECWLAVIEELARDHTVVAPDLLGHGRSAKPRGDYSLGAYAAGARDLLGALGFERGTVAGHSLGGGIALQFAYQFPEYCERLVLVSSGGLGAEVHPLLRAAALPGSELVLEALTRAWVLRAGEAVGAFVRRLGLELGHDLAEFARGYGSLADAEARAAFLHTVRAVLDIRGQRVSALDRLYLARDMPTLIVWGAEDPIIPAAHGRRAAELIPGARLVEIPRSGHWPMLDDPHGLARIIAEFVAGTEPYEFDLGRMRDQLRAGPPPPRRRRPS